jgi:hypothetical protein
LSDALPWYPTPLQPTGAAAQAALRASGSSQAPPPQSCRQGLWSPSRPRCSCCRACCCSRLVACCRQRQQQTRR